MTSSSFADDDTPLLSLAEAFKPRQEQGQERKQRRRQEERQQQEHQQRQEQREQQLQEEQWAGASTEREKQRKERERARSIINREQALVRAKHHHRLCTDAHDAAARELQAALARYQEGAGPPWCCWTSVLYPLQQRRHYCSERLRGAEEALNQARL